LYSRFGVSNKETQVGDIVALISGVSMPMVLRASSDVYEIIGPALLGAL